uniref:Tripeptidyl-peptidase 2 n=1 Tax=Rhabditophanes sp. KR3021 TaxID=114890 RepID=A0AC35UHN6_9BILA
MDKSDGVIESLGEFPLEDCMPKCSTQQKVFLEKYPTYDGRGTVIAVLDTGIDPSLPGLQVTSDGKRKVLEVLDTTGNGDISTDTVVSAVDGYIVGLTGRKLKIPAEWKNPSGKYFIGQKNIYEFYNKELIERITEHKKVKFMASAHNLAVADVRRLLQQHEEEIGGKSEKPEDKRKRDDLIAQIEYLKNTESIVDEGPVADVIVFNDGTKFQTCIDTSYRGRLSLCKLIGDFKETGDVGFINEIDKLSYTVDVKAQGKLTEITVPVGSHGSHVAHIAAACYPEQSKKDGLAPGAQLISICIGDGRLGSTETGAALIRAFNYCIEKKVDVVNLSYGEASTVDNKGKIVDVINNMVNKHGILFISSAGNAGPALTTSGSVGSTTSNVLGIGASITNRMSEAMYSIRQKITPNVYPWSSRGPNKDGFLGVSLIGPGCAVTGVPQYCAKGNQRMNGTSMAGPLVAASVAALLSGMKSVGIPITPYRMKLILENTAIPLKASDPFSQGKGMVSIDDAFEFAKKDPIKSIDTDLTGFQIQIDDGKLKRGIYIRESWQNRKQEYVVKVKPQFKSLCDVDKMINFEKNILLICKDDAICKYPKYLSLQADGSEFSINVDPTQVQKGTVHYAEILAYDSACKQLGPLFSVPITIINPIIVGNDGKFSKKVTALPGIPERTFLKVPNGVDYFDLKIKNEGTGVSKCGIHVVQIFDDNAHRDTETVKQIALNPDAEINIPIRIREGHTAEICLTKTWASDESSNLSLDVQFHGLIPHPHKLTLNSSDGHAKFMLKNTEIKQTVGNISPTLKYCNVSLKPIANKLSPLSTRDLSTDGIQISQMLLTYDLSVSKAAEYTFAYPGLSNELYESPLDHLFIQVFTDTKKYIHSTANYPSRYPIKLEKGEYKILAQLRHSETGVLEKFADLPIVAAYKLAKGIDLEVFNSTADIIIPGAKKTAEIKFLPGESRQFYMSATIPPKTLSEFPVGSYLTGNFTVIRTSLSDTRAIVQYNIQYNITESTKANDKGALVCALTCKHTDEDKKSDDSEVVYNNIVRSALLNGIKNQSTKTKAKFLLDKAIAIKEDAEVYHAYLSKLLQIKNVTSNEIIAVADKIIEFTNLDELYLFFGKKEIQAEESCSIKKKMEKHKKFVVDAFKAKLNIMLDNNLKNTTTTIPKIFREGAVFPQCVETKAVESNGDKSPKSSSSGESTPLEIVEPVANEISTIVTLADIQKEYDILNSLVEESNVKLLPVAIKYNVAQGHFALALASIAKLCEDKKFGNSKVVDEMAKQLVECLEWHHVSAIMSNSKILSKYPTAYRLF